MSCGICSLEAAGRAGSVVCILELTVAWSSVVCMEPSCACSFSRAGKAGRLQWRSVQRAAAQLMLNGEEPRKELTQSLGRARAWLSSGECGYCSWGNYRSPASPLEVAALLRLCWESADLWELRLRLWCREGLCAFTSSRVRKRAGTHLG